LTVTALNGRAEGAARAGAQALTLLSTPTNTDVLRALADRPQSLIELRRAAGSPPLTTMRSHLRTLTERGVLVSRRQREFPGSVDFEMTQAGRELWAVAEILSSWLASAPEGPLQLGSVAAKSAIKALLAGWSTSIVRALAATPLTLTELNTVIAGTSYPSLERRLGAMRLAGQIEKLPGSGRGTPYAITEWLRRAVAPLVMAARWERRNAASATPALSCLDAEAIFLLALPLLRLPPALAGVCRLTVEVKAADGGRLAGASVAVRDGRAVSQTTRLQGDADAWASGSSRAWLGAVIEQDAGRLQIGGDGALCRALVESLHKALFHGPVTTASPAASSPALP
jgi:DNA-binding HxlR family transcriptional regulator